jgi:hypothetical protein
MGDNLRYVDVDCVIGEPCPLQYGPDNARIGVAVNVHAFNAGLQLQDRAHGALESKVVDCIAAVEQGAVNVKQVGVSGVPAESGSHERFPAGGTWDQS